MESFVDGICNLIGFYLALGFMFGICLAPSIVAVVRGHHRWPWIGFLNFTAGWTVAGWIAALAWSVTAIRKPAGIMRTGSTAHRTAQPAERESRSLGRMHSDPPHLDLLRKARPGNLIEAKANVSHACRRNV
jgi:hypothetical protein